MANINAAQGLRAIGSLLGAPMSGRVGRYYIPATDGTAVYIGGLVKPAGAADANGIMSVTGNVSTGNPVVGAVVAFEMVHRDSSLYRVASTERWVYVADDPNQLFEIQDDGVVASTATMVGNVADLTGFTTGSTATGRSTLQISTAAVSASGDGTEDVIMIGLVQRPTNAFGANAKWIVRLNNHFYVDGVAGA